MVDASAPSVLEVGGALMVVLGFVAINLAPDSRKDHSRRGDTGGRRTCFRWWEIVCRCNDLPCAPQLKIPLLGGMFWKARGDTMAGEIRRSHPSDSEQLDVLDNREAGLSTSNTCCSHGGEAATWTNHGMLTR
mmetsp:Transcript_3694/g.11393  ORF Transcript_3694/g.11393 Transcript_3694/m.11393 type:complete len:133 (+) Transcript_3694:62-460(+)|eukprot:scaffold132872_cov35-Tisochrysis_lutea.AAC.2